MAANARSRAASVLAKCKSLNVLISASRTRGRENTGTWDRRGMRVVNHPMSGGLCWRHGQVGPCCGTGLSDAYPWWA